MKAESPLPACLIVGDYETPVGPVQVIVDEAGVVRGLDFTSESPRLARLMDRMYPGVAQRSGTAPAAVTAALDGYFEGRLDSLGQIVHRTRGTRFQERVWETLCDIPAGSTCAYLGISRRIGAPGASRAVGLANGANPVALFIPCHRVIGRSGALTGYAGGLDRKAWLLAHEGASVPAPGWACRHSSTVISQ
jgi:methylated-DNA-[protein]-cysteine S-methyltransferase